MDLAELVKNIISDQVLSFDGLNSALTNAVVNCCDDEYLKEIYIDLYIASYGKKMTKAAADEWIKSVRCTECKENGIKWDIKKCCDIGNSVGIDWDKITKIDWYIALNLEYSRHCKTAEKFKIADDPNFFAFIAIDEWKDKDIFAAYIDYIR